jgi:anti-anti-sigma factor
MLTPGPISNLECIRWPHPGARKSIPFRHGFDRISKWKEYLMELKIMRTDPTVTRIALAGKLDVEGEGQIGHEFRQIVDGSSSNVLVDLSQVSYLASLGIRLLFAGAKSLGASGKKMVVINPQPMVKETLLNSGTVKLIPIAEDEDHAKRLLAY